MKSWVVVIGVFLLVFSGTGMHKILDVSDGYPSFSSQMSAGGIAAPQESKPCCEEKLVDTSAFNMGCGIPLVTLQNFALGLVRNCVAVPQPAGSNLLLSQYQDRVKRPPRTPVI